jgi:uncharacterized protein (DUF111 family)
VGQSSFELATPTGVAILSSFASHYESMTFTPLQRAGYGAGLRDIPGKPNVLAIYQGSPTIWSRDQVVLLETHIDDMDPRLYPHVTDLLFKKGALDVWWSSVGMKKGRPGTAFSVLCSPEQENVMTAILFQETTTLGIRRQALERHVLPRQSKGRFKIAILPHGENKKQVEYEPARKRADRSSIPLRELLK